MIQEFIMSRDPFEQAKLCLSDKIDQLRKMRGDKEVLKEIFAKKLDELKNENWSAEDIKALTYKITSTEILFSTNPLNPIAGSGFTQFGHRGFFRCGPNQITFDPRHAYTKCQLNQAMSKFLTVLSEEMPVRSKDSILGYKK